MLHDYRLLACSRDGPFLWVKPDGSIALAASSQQSYEADFRSVDGATAPHISKQLVRRVTNLPLYYCYIWTLV